MRLTVDEIKLIAFVVLGLLVGATVKHYRDIQRANAAPSAQVNGSRKPTGTRIGGSSVNSDTRPIEREKD